MNQPKRQKSRRWIVIGPGIILALVFALQMVINNHKKTTAPPIIERQVVGGSASVQAGPPAEVDFILQHRRELKLTETQESSLKKLQTEWKVKSKPLMDSMNKAAQEFESYMKSRPGKATIHDIQSHGGSVSELSREVSSLRKVYWEKGFQLLDKKQQETISHELSGGIAGRVSTDEKGR